MFKIYTSTYCRPDLVQLLADSLSVTVNEPYEFIVYVHKNGLKRQWKNVHNIIQGDNEGYYAWRQLIPLFTKSKTVVMHDDLIPVKVWGSDSFRYSRCAYSNVFLYSFDGDMRCPPYLPVHRIHSVDKCPEGWESFCELAANSRVESLNYGTFIHIDKGTTTHPNSPINAHKRLLIENIAKHLGIEPPEPLSDYELSFHRGYLQKNPVSTNDIFWMDQEAAYKKYLEKSNNKNIISEKVSESAIGGPGTELKKILSKFGINSTPDCSCNKKAKLMNEKGIKWCENNIDTIVGWLREEATKRGLPFIDYAGKILVKKAISNAKKK